MAKRSAAMTQASFSATSDMPAPVSDGLGHATRRCHIVWGAPEMEEPAAVDRREHLRGVRTGTKPTLFRTGKEFAMSRAPP